MRSRQFTGRIVTVTNDKVFDEPVYNYTHEFPYIWDELSVPVHYSSDYRGGRAAPARPPRQSTLCREAKIGEEEVRRLEHRFGIEVGEIDPASSGASPRTGWR